jgi:hypothetical protein
MTLREMLAQLRKHVHGVPPIGLYDREVAVQTELGTVYAVTSAAIVGRYVVLTMGPWMARPEVKP